MERNKMGSNIKQIFFHFRSHDDLIDRIRDIHKNLHAYLSNDNQPFKYSLVTLQVNKSRSAMLDSSDGRLKLLLF